MNGNIVGYKVKDKTVKSILAEATILHVGWEMDNAAWAVEFDDGTKGLVTTSHGGLYITKKDELEERLQEAYSSIESIKRVLEAVAV
jgi:hypothetical protein